MASELAAVTLGRTFCLLAVDPGDVHCGVAKFRVLSPADPINRTGRWQAVCEVASEFDPPNLVRMFESFAWPDEVADELRPDDIDLFIVEEFRLYPWMARQQGYSDFKTPRLIGKLEYLVGKSGRRLYMQGASVKKQAVARARRVADDTDAKQYAPQLIKLTKGRYDFRGRNQHIRDAMAHGWYWLLTHPDSPMHGDAS